MDGCKNKQGRKDHAEVFCPDVLRKGAEPE
jgi:hypothetical protein